MWANLLSAIGKGAVKGLGAAGKGIRKGVGAIGDEFEDDDAAPAPTRLPTIAPPNPVNLPITTPPLRPPAGMTPATEPPKDYRGREIGDMSDFQRDQYVRRGGETDAEGKFKVRRSLKDALANAGIGFLSGAASNPDNPLAGGLGGVAAGGAGTAIDPLRGREFKFETLERPRIESDIERGRKTRRERYEDALRQSQVDRAGRQAEIDAANLRRIEAQTEKLRRPEAPRPPIRSDRGLWDPTTGKIIEGTEALPKERPQALREGPDGNHYDVNNPAQAEALRQLNAKLPRDRRGRFITRADERATARAGGGGTSGRNDRAMTKAVEDFDRTKRSLEDATARGDKAMAKDLRRSLQSQAANLSRRYGDRLEVGGGDWPYQKPRGGGLSRAESKRRLMAEGFTAAEAESELNRLGVR